MAAQDEYRKAAEASSDKLVGEVVSKSERVVPDHRRGVTATFLLTKGSHRNRAFTLVARPQQS